MQPPRARPAPSHDAAWYAIGSARRPSARTSSATASQFSSLRLAITTSAPCSANASTISRPRPRLPPVTIATLSVMSNRSVMVLLRRCVLTSRRSSHRRRSSAARERDVIGEPHRERATDREDQHVRTRRTGRGRVRALLRRRCRRSRSRTHRAAPARARSAAGRAARCPSGWMPTSRCRPSSRR